MAKILTLMSQLVKETKERAEAERKHAEYMASTNLKIEAIMELMRDKIKLADDT